MEYRRLGKTELMISAVGLGGHWKGLEAELGRPFRGSGYDDADFENIHAPDFIANRHEVVSRAIELGVNYVDACSPPEVLAYAKALAGRRGAMHLGYSWHTREPRFPEWRTAARLLAGLEESLAEATLDAVDLWRISLPADGIEDEGERQRIEEATIGALALAKRQGKARFTGVSSHDGAWLRMMIARYPEQIEVVLFPVPAASKPAVDQSVFGVAQLHDTGVLGIKPFGGGALFRGDGCDGWRARLAIRGILSNPALTAALPGCASVEQVTNAVAAVEEPRTLDPKERAELDRSAAAMWARVPAWLRRWQDS
jgi:aryl-alcohol dehydrogenase-like predicted oxidoreductase